MRLRIIQHKLCFSLGAAWQEVEQKLGDGDTEESTNSQGPVQYCEKTPSAAMKSKYMHLPLSTLTFFS